MLCEVSSFLISLKKIEGFFKIRVSVIVLKPALAITKSEIGIVW